MLLRYANQQIDLFAKGTPDKIMLSLSGGLDSACLMFLICNNFPDVEIIPYTGKDKNAPFDYQCAVDILSWMGERFPNQHIRDHEWFEFDKNNPDSIKHAESMWEQEKIVVNGKRVERCSSVSGLIKILEMRKFTNRIWKKHGKPLKVSGLTANPPDQEMKDNDFFHLRERRRDSRDKATPYKLFMYEPLVVVDKRFVADVYHQHDLWDLYELTGSCIGSAVATNYFTEPCGECFWCHEKEWAFKELRAPKRP